MGENDTDSTLVPVLCVFIGLWTTFFLAFWQRKQATYAMLWGTTNFRQEEQTRPHVRRDAPPHCLSDALGELTTAAARSVVTVQGRRGHQPRHRRAHAALLRDRVPQATAHQVRKAARPAAICGSLFMASAEASSIWSLPPPTA